MRRIALLTDFGTRDPYVAAMKGVIAARCDATIVDLTHDIAPFDAFEAAWFLKFVLNDYPVGTIFVSVVDPGVGSSRRILVASHRDRIFLAPDNGLLSLILDSSSRIHAVESSSLFLPTTSTTFHGRDRFAPVAAAIANGVTLEALGPKIENASIERLPYEQPDYSLKPLSGTIVSVDRFGNLVTDLAADRIEPPYALRIGQVTVGRTARTYAEMAETRDPFVIVGSRGTLEISVAKGSAADILHLGRFDRVEILTDR